MPNTELKFTKHEEIKRFWLVTDQYKTILSDIYAFSKCQSGE
ncbi:MAG: hypothetical protein Q8S54_00270 [Bacteroidota bacterium]|nr:hypothetical protein [Bacteroidota bacterium]